MAIFMLMGPKVEHHISVIEVGWDSDISEYVDMAIVIVAVHLGGKF
jgi:hypothetical protein